MTFAIFTSVVHVEKDSFYYGYGPFIREMNLWSKYVDKIVVLAPKTSHGEILPMDLHYNHSDVEFVEIPSFNLTSILNIFKTLIVLPWILYKMMRVMNKVEHLHIRCPSNVGLLGCLAQIFFPNLKKSTKYAGNWDPNSIQPWSYRLQKKILSNTLLTKNMKVLVYGEWPEQSKNIIPFISASYYRGEIEKSIARSYKGQLHFVFAGSLVVGKRPLFTIQIIEELNRRGISSRIDIFGSGVMFEALEQYVEKRNLKDFIFLHGNKDKETVKQALKKADFNILPSKSEGWPKAIAEGMFFGCIPISTKISCLPWMLDHGNRGILIEANLIKAVDSITEALKTGNLEDMSKRAQQWSQQFTLDALKNAIHKTLVN